MHLSKQLRIATRKSPLAMWQAEHVADRLRELHPSAEVNLVPMSTKGDIFLSKPLGEIGGKGLFLKELEQAMLDGRADLAVHSMKDVPVDLPDGLCLAVIMAREDPGDAWVSNRFDSLEDLPRGACVGTSSLRRRCQLLAQRPDLRVENLRGNVNTRLAKLDAGQFDGIVLASSGLKRLGFGDRIRAALATDHIVPAVGQGALGIECRQDADAVLQAIRPLICTDTTACVLAERALNGALGGGCHVPVAGFAQLSAQTLTLTGVVGSLDGRQILHESASAPVGNAAELGRTVAAQLKRRGALDIIRNVSSH